MSEKVRVVYKNLKSEPWGGSFFGSFEQKSEGAS